MNAPLRIQIDDATKRKADMFDALQEFGSDATDDIIDRLRSGAEADQASAIRLEKLSRRYALSREPFFQDMAKAMEKSARYLRFLAGRSQDRASEIDRANSLHLMPEEW